MAECIKSAWGGQTRIDIKMEGIQDIKEMLRMVLEQQEKLVVKVEGMEAIQNAQAEMMKGLEHEVQKIVEIEKRMEKRMEQQQGETMKVMEDVSGQLRFMNWERLRWRRVEWERIPPDSRVRVIPFLAVEDLLNLNSAISDKRLRKDMRKSYKSAVIPAFDKHRFTDKDNFKGLRWVMKAKVDLQQCELVLQEQEGGLIESAASVLRWLVDNEREDLAAVHGTKSGAKDMMKHDDSMDEEVSTLWVAAKKGYVEVVCGLLERDADIDKATDDVCTPLLIASQEGHVEVVRALLDQGAEIHKAMDDGATPLFIASQEGHVEVVRALLDQGADINKTWDGLTPLQIALQENHTEIIHLLELAAQV